MDSETFPSRVSEVTFKYSAWFRANVDRKDKLVPAAVALTTSDLVNPSENKMESPTVATVAALALLESKPKGMSCPQQLLMSKSIVSYFH